MKVYTIFRNLVQSIKKAIAHSDENLQTAKDYTDSIATDLVKIGLFTGGTVNVPAGGAVNVTVNFTTPSGYKAVDIVGARTNGDVLAIYASGLTTTTQASTWVRNWSSNQRSVTVTVFILFIKNVGGVVFNLLTMLSPKGVTA